MTTQTATRERPILFSGEMIRAILAGRKVQTRRLARTFESPASSTGHFIQLSRDRSIETDDRAIPFCPHGQPGNRLWCKETWALIKVWLDPDTGHVEEFEEWQGTIPKHHPSGWNVVYRADWDASYDHPDDRHFRWRPSIFMPKWASRVTLEITGVRVQWLQGITLEDATAEGIPEYGHEFRDDITEHELDVWRNRTTVENFADLWDSLNDTRAPWESNPFVWCISFRRIKP